MFFIIIKYLIYFEMEEERNAINFIYGNEIQNIQQNGQIAQSGRSGILDIPHPVQLDLTIVHGLCHAAAPFP